MLLRLDVNGNEDKNGKYIYPIAHISRWRVAAWGDVEFWTTCGHRVTTKITAARFLQIYTSCIG